MKIRGRATNHVKNRRMPVGRYIYALEDMSEIAKERALAGVKEAVDNALVTGRKAKRVQFSYEQTRDQTSKARGRSVELDQQIDAIIVAIRNVVRDRIIGIDGDPIEEAAQLILKTVYPRGARAITHLSFEAQLATMTVMIEHFRNDLAEAVTLTGVDREVSLMEELVEEFRTELRVSEKPGVTYDELKEAISELHEHTALVRAVCVAAYPSLDQAATEARESLLAPLVDQENRVAEAQRRQRRVLDVDPSTGEEIDDDHEPVSDVVIDVEDREPSPAANDPVVDEA